jgi:hypothetical protein
MNKIQALMEVDIEDDEDDPEFELSIPEEVPKKKAKMDEFYPLKVRGNVEETLVKTRQLSLDESLKRAKMIPRGTVTDHFKLILFL